MENKQINKVSNDELSLKEIILIVKDWWNYLLSKWLIILICGLVGGGLGIVYSLMNKPKYTAKLSFSLIESDASMSGLASLASNFGFGGLLAGGGGPFSGNNLLEIIRSRYAVEYTLLNKVNIFGKEQTLADAYIEVQQLNNKWKKNKSKVSLHNLSFPVALEREDFSREQDSVLYEFYKEIVVSNNLFIARKDKEMSIVDIKYTSINEVFSKTFIETLMDVTYNFYTKTRTAQSRSNIEMMQHKADSVKKLYENAIYQSATYSKSNINPALQIAAVPGMKQETNAQIYGTVYAEILKNLETLKLDLARVTPLVQIIDVPRYPLQIKRTGKIKGLIIGGFLGGLLTVLFLLFRKHIKSVMS